MKPNRMILRGEIFLFCLFNGLLDLLGQELGTFNLGLAIFSFCFVLFLLFTTLFLCFPPSWLISHLLLGNPVLRRRTNIRAAVITQG